MLQIKFDCGESSGYVFLYEGVWTQGHDFPPVLYGEINLVTFLDDKSSKMESTLKRKNSPGGTNCLFYELSPVEKGGRKMTE